jgi:PBP1b-binding outer membrane lipoprotein LpoB
MSITKTFAAALTFAALALAGCGGGVEGTYKLDKAEVKKNMEAEVAKLPADQQGLAKLAVALIDAMDMTVELQAGGKLSMKSTMPSLEKDKPGQVKEETGTWKQEGDSVILESGKGKPLKCKAAGGKLSCEAEKAGDPAFVFVKG